MANVALRDERGGGGRPHPRAQGHGKSDVRTSAQEVAPKEKAPPAGRRAGRVISRIEFARGGYSCHKTSAMHFKVDVEGRIADVISELARVFGVVGFRLQDAPDHPHHLHLLADPTFP